MQLKRVVALMFTTAFIGCGDGTDNMLADETSEDTVFPVENFQALTGDPVIGAAGDMACDPADTKTASTCHQVETSNLLLNQGLTTVMVLGDNQYENGTLSKYQAVYDPSWGRLNSISKPIPGNHEYRDPAGGAKGYFDYFNGTGVACGKAGCRGKGYYTYTVGSWQVIALNSNIARDAASTQVTWLKNTLANSTSKCVLAYWHHARFSSGADHGGNTSVTPFWKELYNANADVVLAGHEHLYERFAPQTPTGVLDNTRGIRQFVVGSGGKNHDAIGTIKPNSQFRDNTHFGVMKMTLHATSYDWQFVDENGVVRDSGTANCH